MDGKLDQSTGQPSQSDLKHIFEKWDRIRDDLFDPTNRVKVRNKITDSLNLFFSFKNFPPPKIAFYDSPSQAHFAYNIMRDLLKQDNNLDHTFRERITREWESLLNDIFKNIELENNSVVPYDDDFEGLEVQLSGINTAYSRLADQDSTLDKSNTIAKEFPIRPYGFHLLDKYGGPSFLYDFARELDEAFPGIKVLDRFKTVDFEIMNPPKYCGLLSVNDLWISALFDCNLANSTVSNPQTITKIREFTHLQKGSVFGINVLATHDNSEIYCFVSDYPTKISRDTSEKPSDFNDFSNFHSSTERALQFGDGTGLHFIRGFLISETVFDLFFHNKVISTEEINKLDFAIEKLLDDQADETIVSALRTHYDVKKPRRFPVEKWFTPDDPEFHYYD